MSMPIHERKNAGTARKIKNRYGQEAYLAYKNHGIVPDDLDTNPPPIQTSTGNGVEMTETPFFPDTTNEVTEVIGNALRDGDIVRDKDGTRYRVQRNTDSILRLASQTGVRDIPWEQVDGMGLIREVHNQYGPAARRLNEVRDEAERLGIDTSGMATVKSIVEAIGTFKAGDNALAQIDPMLAKDDAKNLQDFGAPKPWLSSAMLGSYWNNDAWSAEDKVDGNRLKLHFTPDGVRIDSRRRDAKSRLFSEKSANFPYMLDLKIPELYGTVLDSEGVIPVKSGVLPSGVFFYGMLSISTACVNAGPPMSKQIQDKFQPMEFHVFDILRDKGEVTTNLPFSERRELVNKIVNELWRSHPETGKFIKTTRIATSSEAKLALFEQIMVEGGEGIIFKKRSSRYSEGKRPKDWQKLKKFQEVDAFVNGYVPGQAGNEGLVGALELAVEIEGKTIGVAAVSQLTREQRLEFTDEDGSLRREVYDRVVTFRGQELTKNGRFRHAIFVQFREDKGKEDCNGYEIEDELRAMGLIKAPSAQDTFL